MTTTEQIHYLWSQGLDTYEIARRTGWSEAGVHREIIRERAARQAAARPWASAQNAPHHRPAPV